MTDNININADSTKTVEHSIVTQLALLNNNLTHMKTDFDKQAKEQSHDNKNLETKIDALTGIIQKKADRSDLQAEVNKLTAERERLLAVVRSEIADVKTEAKASTADLREETRVELAEIREEKVDWKSLRPYLWIGGAIGAAVMTGMGTTIWEVFTKGIGG